MSYRLDAVVGDFDRLRAWAGGAPGAVVAPLGQRLGLLPLSAALRGDLPRVLRELSGPGAPEHRDLFVEVGLGRGRDEEDWRRAALGAQGVADYDEWCATARVERDSEERAAAERAVRERLRGVPVPLDGKAIMTLLGMPEGRTVGAAIRHLQQLRIDHGPLTREEAASALRAWAAEQGARPSSRRRPSPGSEGGGGGEQA
ncbi:hypothetical protein [Streptomyces sp. NPDC051079]|uniref:hypothetical protein n=1 Tax=Streptomyces sp. NPDC051079 TaxID=3155043 RepID=UPI00344F36F5